MKFSILIAPVTALIIGAPVSRAQTSAGTSRSAQESFATPGQAVQELLRAAEAGDTAAISALFGPDGKEIISSGDPVQDRNTRATFAQKARTAMKLQKDPTDENRVFLLIGEDDFEFPIPLVRANGRWYFDTQGGKREILARRIGSNELDAIAVCNEYVQAQYQYAAEDSDQNGVHQYAQKFISSPGSKDGLYWPAASGAGASAISARITQAQAQGYRRQAGRMVPYHGYYYKILTGQGPNAPGGPKQYLVQGLMLGGFGLVAWPAEYGNSGIMTFMVNQDGVVYQKDLGPNTDAISPAMTEFNPDQTWRPVR